MLYYIKVVDDVYELEDEIKKYKIDKRLDFWESKKGSYYHSGKINHLITEEVIEGVGVYLEVGYGYYKDHILGNMYYRDVNITEEEKDFFIRNRFRMVRPLGTSGIVRTKDGYILINKKKEKDVTGKGYYTTSYTGDVVGLVTGTLEDNYGVLVFKELGNRLGLQKEDVTGIQLVSRYWDKEQVSKPEFLFLVDINITKEQLREKQKTRGNEKGIKESIFLKEAGIVPELIGKKISENLKEYLRVRGTRGGIFGEVRG